jgi:hypothetical protein
MPILNFITDGELNAAVKNLLDVATKSKLQAQKEFGRNVIDPFALLIEMSGFGLDAKLWKTSEMTRQAQKSLQNHVGEFHQIVLGSVDGWKNLKTGAIVDLESIEKNAIAEVKNKYNTISGGKLADLYSELEKLVMPKTSKYKGYTAYYVEILPKSPIPYDKEFTPSDKAKGAKCAHNPLIRQIDGKSFYAKVTGDPDALSKLFNVLPDVIEDLCSTTTKYKFKDRICKKVFYFGFWQVTTIVVVSGFFFNIAIRHLPIW